MINKEMDSSLGIYISEINRTPLLTPQEEVELGLLIRKGGPEGDAARKRFIEANLRLVVKMAKQFSNQGLSLSDMIQEGNIGLIESVERFNPDLGFRFSTFSAYWIRQAIQRGIAKKARQIRLPVRKHRSLAQMEYLRSQFYIQYGRYPDDKEMAKLLKLSVKTVKQLTACREMPVSLEAPVGRDGQSELEEFVEDKETLSPRNSAVTEQLREKIELVLGFLSERERKILLWRYGFSSGYDVSLRGISKKVGLSQEGVRRIEKEALNKLRRPAIKAQIEGFI